MSVQNLAENRFDDFIIGSIHGEDTEVPLESQIDSERPRLLIQTGKEEQILNILSLLQLFPVKNRPIVNNLPQKLDRFLSAVFVNIGHVQIVNKADQGLASCRSEGLAAFLFNHAFDVLLQTQRVSKTGEVNSFMRNLIGFGGH